jgi:predicted DNA-binding protein with PD1-like motif
MLVSQFQEVRRFMGRLDSGQDILAGFKTVCRENGINSAWVQVSAVLRNVRLQAIANDASGLGEVSLVEKVVFFPTLQGNVSLLNDLVEVRLHGVGSTVGDPPVPAVGIVRGGEVIICEFFLTSCDDTTLIRDADDPSHLEPWVQIQAPTDIRPKPVMSVPIEGPMARPAPPPLHAQPDDEEVSELSILEMAVGDYVDHPRFGVCKIVHAPQDEKVSIRLPTGKHADLHLGVMRVHPSRQMGGRKVFKVEMRKKV